MKRCQDCKHFGVMTDSGAPFGCSKQIDKVNYINGDTYYQYAQWVRENKDACGPEGQWWEEKTEIIR